MESKSKLREALELERIKAIKEREKVYKRGDLDANKYWGGFLDALAFAQAELVRSALAAHEVGEPSTGERAKASASHKYDTVWIVEQNGHVHSCHATLEHARTEKGENLRMPNAPWAILGSERAVAINSNTPQGLPVAAHEEGGGARAKLLVAAAEYLMAKPEEDAGDWCDAFNDLHEQVSLEFGSEDHSVWRAALASQEPSAVPAPQCNGPFGDEEACPVHGETIRKARGR